MAERWQFIAHIIEEPQNSFWRLMYADWLEERGDCDQALRLRERALESVYIECERCKTGQFNWRRSYPNLSCRFCLGNTWMLRSPRWLLGLEEAKETARVVELLPVLSWSGAPEVYEEDVA